MRVFVFILAFGLEISSFAQVIESKKVLNLPDVLLSVDHHYPLIVGAMQDLEKARADLLSAKGGFDPTLKSTYQTTLSGEYENRFFDTVVEQPTALWGTRFFAGYRNGQGNFGPYDERLLTQNDGEVRAGIALPLLRGGMIDDRRARIDSSQKAVEAAEESTNLQKLNSKRLATHRYYEWVAAVEKLKIAQSLLKIALDRDEAMSHRVLKGDAAKIEQTDNIRSVIQRESAVIAATRAVEKAALELSLFHRDPAGNPLLVSSEEAPSDGLKLPQDGEPNARTYRNDLTKFAQEVSLRHPEVRRFQAQIAQNEVEKKLAKNSILPRLDAEFAVSKDFGQGSISKSIPEYKAAIKLEFPLLLRTGRGRADATAAQGIKLDAAFALARDRIRVAVQDATQAIEASRKRIFLIKNEVDLSIKIEEAERIKFKHGDSNILTVNLREQATADAKSRIIDALTDFYRAQADFAATALGHDISAVQANGN